MLSHRTVECLITLLVATLLGGCVAQRPVEETAVATHMVGPRPEQTPTTPSTLTSIPLPTPTSTLTPTHTTIPVTPTPPPTPTPRFPLLPTSLPPATPLPPVPVFLGPLRHDLQLHLGGEPSTLSYLTGVRNPTHLDALRQMVAANWGNTRFLDDYYVRPRFSPDRQMMIFRLDHPLPDDGLGGGRPVPDVVILNESGSLVVEPFAGSLVDWLPHGEGIISQPYDRASLHFFDGRPIFYFDSIIPRSLWVSPDGNTIVYTGWMVDDIDTSGLLRMNRDGSSSTVIFPLSDHSRITELTWSPDGNWLAFLVDGYLWILELATGNTRATNVFGIPVWSPDSQRLAIYTSHMVYDNEDVIHLVDPLNGQITELWVTIPPENIFERQYNYIADVVWSPDGEWLAFLLQHNPFAMGVPSTEDIWLTDLDRTTLIRLTDDGVRKDELRWWP